MPSKAVRQLLTIVMDVLVIAAVIVVLRVVVQFFGVLAAEAWGKSVVSATHFLVVPFGIRPIVTPYGGIFDVTAALTVLVLLAAEWALGMARQAS
jgi:hypothetical protein